MVSSLYGALIDVIPTFTVSAGISLVTERCGRKRTIYINGVVCGNDGIVATYGSSDKPLSYFYGTGFIQYIPSGNNETYSIVLTINTEGQLVAYYYEDGTILRPCNQNHRVYGQISYYLQ